MMLGFRASRGVHVAASARLGLPSKMSDETIATIKATAPVVAPVALDITRTFYHNMLGEHPELFAFFNRSNQAHGTQPQTLASAVVAYASHIDKLGALVGSHGCPVDMMAHTHCGLQVQPEHYPIVHKYLMGAIATTLGEVVTPEIAAAWSESVLFLAKVLVDREQDLYDEAAARPGGWSGFRDFDVVSVEELTPNTKSFTFVRQGDDGHNGIDFSPGQFLTLRVDPRGDGMTAPRHYTITSAPGTPELTCTIKRVKGGEVSTYLHDSVQPGSTVQLSPPFGTFTPRESARPTVLISAGIGETPMVSMAGAFDEVALVAHVDASEQMHAFSDRFASYNTLFKYKDETNTDADALVGEVCSSLPGDASEYDFYVCGAPAFQAGVTTALKAAGGEHIYSEKFTGHTSHI